MKIEIDQSGKVEQTSKNTIVALSNHVKISVQLSRKTKRELQNYFISIGKMNTFSYTIFALCVAFLLKNYDQPYCSILIDREYDGHEAFITQQLNDFLKKLDVVGHWHIIFGYVGKSSPAHSLGSQVNKDEIKPTVIIRLEDCMKLLTKKNDRDLHSSGKTKMPNRQRSA